MAKYSIRNYNAFLKEARAQHGLSLKEARAAYKGVSERLGRPARGVDVSRHPRISKQEIGKAQKTVAKQERAEKREQKQREKTRAEKPPAAAPAAKPKPFQSLAQYIEWFEEADYYDYEEADGTVDY